MYLSQSTERFILYFSKTHLFCAENIDTRFPMSNTCSGMHKLVFANYLRLNCLKVCGYDEQC